jgi:hypothetical protein
VADLNKLKAEIDSLSPPQKLRLAAELLENRQAKLAHTIAERVVLELGAALMLAEMKRG